MVPRISVIIPVYNAEKFLRHCLDTLLAQTFKDFEVILIDDGSRDRSSNICDAYAYKDTRVHVYHKENGGVSAARQKGLELASGAYIIHVDADDWVAPSYLEVLYEEAVRTNADITICDYIEVYPDKKVYKVQKPTSTSADDFVLDLCTKLHGSCWNKLIKASVIRENKIDFPDGINLREDKLFNLHVALCSSTISYAPKALYYYFCSHLGGLASSQGSLETSMKSYIYGNNLFAHFLSNKSNSALLTAQRRFKYPTIAYLLIYEQDYVSHVSQEISSLSFTYIPDIWATSQISALYRLTLILSTFLPLKFLYSIIKIYKWLTCRKIQG